MLNKLPAWDIPAYQRQHVLVALGYGAVLLGWLTPEDNTVLIVSILGAGLSLLIGIGAVLRWLGRRALSPRQWIPGLVLFGAAVGFGSVWCTVSLMIFKNAWHSHAAPDFASTVVVEIIHRLIPWTVSGALVGAAAACLRIAQFSSD